MALPVLGLLARGAVALAKLGIKKFGNRVGRRAKNTRDPTHTAERPNMTRQAMIKHARLRAMAEKGTRRTGHEIRRGIDRATKDRRIPNFVNNPKINDAIGLATSAASVVAVRKAGERQEVKNKK